MAEFSFMSTNTSLSKMVRIKHDSSPINYTSEILPTIHNPQKNLKIIKRIRSTDASFENLEAIEEDFVLENEGDIKAFLRDKSINFVNKKFTPKYDSKGKIMAHSIIGSTKMFTTPKSNNWPTNQIKVSNPTLNRTMSHMSMNSKEPINYDEKFKDRLKEIEKNSKIDISKEEKIMSSLNLYDKLRRGREQRILDHFDKVQNE